MRPRTLLLFAFVTLPGAAVAVLPALAAAPSEAKLELNENCYVNAWACWATPGSGAKPQPTSTVTIAAGGELRFADNTSFDADVIWMGSAPVCSGVPASPAVKWEGECRFEQPGTYKFESPTLWIGAGFDYTKYEVIVQAAGSTASTPTGTPTTTTSSNGSTSPSGSNTSTAGSQTQAGGTSGAGAGNVPTGLLYVGSASSACKLPSMQRGQSVHGSVDVAHAGAGGRLEVRLLAARGVLESATQRSHVQVGRLVRSSLHAGNDAFAVSLNAKARHALHTRGHLALIVKVVIASTQGATVTFTRSVLVGA